MKPESVWTDQPTKPGWYAFEGSEWESEPTYLVDGVVYEEWQEEWTEEAEEYWHRYELELYPVHKYRKVPGKPFQTILFVRYTVIGERWSCQGGSWPYKGDPVLGYIMTHHPWYNGMNGLDKLTGRWLLLDIEWEKSNAIQSSD